MEPAALRETERPAARLRPFSLGAQRVRLAEASDSDAIAALNHRTFVQELGGLAGLAWVAADPSAVGDAAAAEWPPALDLPRQWRSAEPCHTLPSPQLLALREALLRWSPADRRGARFERYRELGRRVRAGLRAAGLEPLVPDAEASPVVTTFPVPAGTTTEEFLARMQGAGHRLAGASRYLRERGWAQVATLGEVSDADLEDLLAALR